MVRGVSQINIRTGTRSRNLKSLLSVIHMTGIADKGSGCIGRFGIVQDTFRDIVKRKAYDKLVIRLIMTL